MADSSRTIMTDAGFALEARIRAGQTKIEFTRASISTADHFKDTDDVLAKLTVLDDVQQDGQVTDVQVIDDTTVHVQIDVDQTKAPADYEMRSAGLYAKDDDGAEVLYGVTALQDPVYVHKDDDGSYLGFSIDTAVGRSASVTIKANPANMVTQQVFESTMKNYYTKAEVDAKFVTDDDFASKLPRNIATTDAANTFAKSQTLAGGATDGAGNAIATTKDISDGDAETLKSAKDYADTKISGKADDSKVVHTSDMRKPASDVAGIEEVNAKADTSAVDQLKTNLTNQVSTLQTQVDNSAVGINLLTGTSSNLQTSPYAHDNATGGFIHNFSSDELSTMTGNQVTVRAFIHNTMTHTVNLMMWTNYGGVSVGTGVPAGTDGYSTITNYSVSTKSDTWGNITIRAYADNVEINGVPYKELKLEKGNVATDWCPNPDDKVNVSDMRKPASDVAGIEEVSTLQTQVDNSAVGTNLLINSNFSDESLTYWTVDTGVTSSFDSNGNLVLTVVNATANNRIYYSNQILDAGTTYAISFYAYVDSSSTSSSVNVEVGPYDNLTSIAVSGTTLARYTGLIKPVLGSGILTIAVGAFNSGEVGDIVHITKIKLEKGSVATDWCPNQEDKVNVADMRKPASDVAGIEEVNAKQDKIGYTPANAANMVHRNPDTGVVSEPVDFTNAKANGHSIIPIETSTDKDTAQTNSTTTPNVIYLY